MADRGSPTANHLDHPHINVTPTPNPSTAGGPAGCLTATTGGAPIAAPGEWVAPLDAPITSRFGPRNLLGGTFHYGTDFAAACGTPIYAAADGIVTYTGGPYRGLTGNVVFLDHGNETETSYNHMDPGGILVRPGQHVTAGQVIALVGNTGNSTGCHLHYAVHTAGQPIDAEPFMAAQGVPLG